MRVSENRYMRDLRRIYLAERMIRHEVRTQWICLWAGISDERVRNLYRSYDPRKAGVARHRGPSPKVLAPLLRTAAMRSELSAFAGLILVLKLLPDSPVPNARKALPSVELGERLCHAYELYKAVVPAAKLTMDQVILLIVTLAEGSELLVGHCKRCGGSVLRDRLGAERRFCEACRRDGAERDSRDERDAAATDAGNRSEAPGPKVADQQSLF